MSASTSPNGRRPYLQEPIAVVGMACRLPGQSNNPRALWEFLKKGGIASTTPPKSRFDITTHHDGSKKPKTMRSPGGMFMEYVDPEDFDAPFFGISRTDAIAMDPQQRQLLEVVYEGLENAGIALESLDGAKYACLVGSYACDYADMQARDPDDRAPSITIGVGRAILSNRISHYLNIKGPSFTVDTACSGSLVSVDVACRYLTTGEIDGAIVAGANMYMSPDHNMDGGAMKGASSATGKCHTFDIKADGYIKAEGINAVILKRLDDAIRDKDPIRAVIRGTATNSDGRTPGIASPSSEAQAAAIRAAYANAQITDLKATTYLECHGTGTQAGDPLEVNGAASVFAATRPADDPLLIGSIKSNIGHSEPAAGISGLLKAILALENGFIPGNPTFETPNPKIDFEALKVKASRTGRTWPAGKPKRASVNSFGYGGSNAHAVLDATETVFQGTGPKHLSSYSINPEDFFADPPVYTRPYTLVLSANSEKSLRANADALAKHLANPAVSLTLPDLAYTLSERRSRHFHRAYIITQSQTLDTGDFVYGKRNVDAPRIGFVFTGQGAQWPQMGKDLVDGVPLARSYLKHLDDVLQSLPKPPSWSLLNELVQPRRPDVLRQPEFSQPLVTALQLVIIEVFKTWNLRPQSVVGHSSGEIAAACAAGRLTPEEAIKIAFFRGQAVVELKEKTKSSLGMLAVGLGAEAVQPYLEPSKGFVQIACYNSPNSVTLSGETGELEKVKERLENDKCFARMLQVNMAYHSKYMADIAARYKELLDQSCKGPLRGDDDIKMFSSVTGHCFDGDCDSAYWTRNLLSPVKFSATTAEMLTEPSAPDLLIEIGPTGALAAPITQIKRSLPGEGAHIQYYSAYTRGKDALKALYDVAGRLFIAGGSINYSAVNGQTETDAPSVIIDLPNYSWDHTTKYWWESEASKDWRFRQFPHHDLLGSKVLGTIWQAPSWRKILRLEDLPWLRDHKMGSDIVFPGSGYMAMAIEAAYQTTFANALSQGKTVPDNYRYRLRNVKFPKALVLEEGKESRVMLTFAPVPGSKDSWYEFKVSSLNDGSWSEHSYGLVCLERDHVPELRKDIEPLTYPVIGRLWYKAMHDAGYNFGPQFQKHLEVESVTGQRHSRSIVDLVDPASEYAQSHYPMHPAALDGCMQTCAPSLWNGDRASINYVLVPNTVDDLIIYARSKDHRNGVAFASSYFKGPGRAEETKNYKSNTTVYDQSTGQVLMQLTGLSYHKLDTRENLHAAHNYSRLSWKADVEHLRPEKLSSLSISELTGHEVRSDSEEGKVDLLLDLIAHKQPNLKVLEINLLAHSSDSIWIDSENQDHQARAACTKYTFATGDAAAMVEAEEKYSSAGNADFALVELHKDSEDFVSSTDRDYDFIILRTAPASPSVYANITRNARNLVKDGGRILLLEHDANRSGSASSDDLVHVRVNRIEQVKRTIAFFGDEEWKKTQEIPPEQLELQYRCAYLAVANSPNAVADSRTKKINLVHLVAATAVTSKVKQVLSNLGWQVSEHSPLNFPANSSDAITLVVDELNNPLLTTIENDEWKGIQGLLTSGSNILWVTVGSQFKVTKPDTALIHGLGRTVRAEDPSVRLTTLDVEAQTGPHTTWAIDEILKTLQTPAPKKRVDSEYAERNGAIFVSRIYADEAVNHAEKDDSSGGVPVTVSLHESPTTIRYQCERPGTLDSLQYSEVSSTELPLEENHVEVEIFAAGVNFKDIAVSMGIVPENHHLLGLEGAGTIRRLGPGVKSFNIGQRVGIFEKGTFANRIIASTERTYALPDDLSFEDASTLPSVYLTSIYSMFNLASTKKGDRVLIHSASGGIGIACINLCKYLGAEIFATVGTDEKRSFLMGNFGIPSDHIFNSRDASFATDLMRETNGYGVDVIINSLTGDLLDASWRCIAEGGTMVEIGKKDLLARNSLAMDPFLRNASYRGFDMSHKHVTDTLIAQLIAQMMDLLARGHIKPISPIKTFNFDDIASAFRFMRGGNHFGKIVITDGPDAHPQVQARPAPRMLDFQDKESYLIVGGLKGLCGSLAIKMAQQGARHLVILARSGYDDERSQSTIQNIQAQGCEVDLIMGDVSVLADVQRTFKEATVPIRGVIQGAMVLRDKLFGSMTVKEYHTTISSKVQGTWNLHDVSLAQKVPLRFFTMLSSVSGVVGQKGQANYAAANVFLDNFANFRQNLGLVATSVDLGAIEDIGYMHEHSDLVVNLDKAAWTPINESLFHKIVRFSLLQQGVSNTGVAINSISTQQMITSVAAPQKDTSALLNDARFGPLCFNQGKGSGRSDGPGDVAGKEIQAFFVMLRSGTSDHTALVNACVTIINRQFTQSLRLAEPMEPAKSPASYGLDSLAAVEFRNWARQELDVEVTTLEVTNASSLVNLAEKIVNKLIETTAATAAAK